MIKDFTDFTNNAVGIDPPGCGCTDCIIGNSIPLDYSWDMDELAKQAIRGRPVINRTSMPLALVRSEPTIRAVPEGYPDRWRFDSYMVVAVSEWELES